MIICTYNRAELLARALGSLAGQSVSRDEYEVVVVDDGSEDETAGVCARARGEIGVLRYVSIPANVGLGWARNVGVEAARGDMILFMDDDCIAEEGWVERMREGLAREPIVSGAVAPSARGYLALCHHIAEFHGTMPGQKGGPRDFIAGASMGFRRSVLAELGGFRRTRCCAEDIDLILRAREKGYRPMFLPEAVVTHDPGRTSLSSLFSYAATHAAAMIHLRNDYREVLRTPFVLRRWWLVPLAAPVIALRVTAGIYMGNRSLLRFAWTAPVVFALKLAWCVGAAQGLLKDDVEGRDDG